MRGRVYLTKFSTKYRTEKEFIGNQTEGFPTCDSDDTLTTNPFVVKQERKGMRGRGRQLQISAHSKNV